MFEHPLLSPEAASETDELIRAADNAVAGYYDWDGIAMVRSAHGARGFGLSNFTGHLAVSSSGAKRDRAKAFPNSSLKGSAHGVYCAGEGGQSAAEIHPQLLQSQ